MPTPEPPQNRASDGARVINLGEYRAKREAPLQAAKDRHPAYRAAKKRKEEEGK